MNTLTDQLTTIDILMDSFQGVNLVGEAGVVEPGARTNWHYHPDGQTLLAIGGEG